ncbi:hypothetical protein EDC04DRAFT_2698722 [Pisolithus marmoratus]|nr:hypothetical protein EDC04DRAFT_2698722 [Pisolithus marmoratus]
MMNKFEMRDLMNRVKCLLVQPSFLEKEPLRVFAIAYRFGFEAETRLAARNTLRHPIFSAYIKELEHIPASAYHKTPPVPPANVVLCCVHHSLSWPLSDGKIHDVNAWFVEYMERARSALQGRPCGEVVSDPLLLMDAMETAAHCHTCRSFAYLDMNTFIREHFLAEIEKVIDMVDLDIPFHLPA